MNTRLGSAVIALLLLTACRDEVSTPRLNSNPPASFQITTPDTVVQGQPFEVTVTALDKQGMPDPDWSGQAALEVSAGTVSPATVVLSNGTVTLHVTISGHAGAVTLLAANGPAESPPRSLTVLSGAPPARVEIVPSSVLLTAQGEAQAFTVRAYDAQGAPTTVTNVEWRSSNTAVLGIDAAGNATAGSTLGSAQVTATVDGVEATPALVLFASPAQGAVLIPDSRILSDPVPVDEEAGIGPGWRYRIRVQGNPPAAGELVLGTGERALAGRVVAVQAIGAEHELTVELVPLRELFTSLRVRETMPLVEMEASAPAAAARLRNLRGRMQQSMADYEFKVAGFECKASVEGPLDIVAPSLNVNPSLVMDFAYEDEFEHLLVKGSITGTFNFGPRITAAFEGSVGCERKWKTFTVPFGGPLSLFFGIQVPVGIGFQLKGKLEVAEFGFDISASATASAELGIKCSQGNCTSVTEFDGQRNAEFEFVWPDVDEQFRAELSAHGYLFAKPSLGGAISKDPFELLSATLGVEQTLNLATTHGQVADTSYASDFALNGRLVVGAGKGINDAIEKLSELFDMDISLNLNVVDDTLPLASSPRGTFTITPDAVAPGDSTQLGDLATFRVTLDPVTYLGIHSVDRIEFFWKKTNEDSTFTLEPGRPACTEIKASPGQTTFECKTDFPNSVVGKQEFYAFVHARLFGLTLPVPLEISNNALATVTVKPQECNAEPPDYEYWGAPFYRSSLEIDSAGGKASGSFIANSPTDFGFTGSIQKDNSFYWVSVRADFEVSDYIMVLPLESYTGHLTIFMHVKQTGTITASDDRVDGGIQTDAFELRSAPGTQTFEIDEVWSDVLDEDGAWIDGRWIALRRYGGGLLRSNLVNRSGTISMRSSMDILDYAHDSTGREIPILVCSASGIAW